MDNSQSDSSFSSGATFEDSPDSDPEFDPNLEWIETADVEKSFRIPKTNPYPSSKDVLQPDTIFSNFFDQKIMDMLVNYSNNYNHYLKAQENTLLRYPKTDKVVTEGTLRKYLAARILMVNAKIPNIKNYWTMTITKTTPNINSMLTWYKFQVLDEKLCIYDPLAPHNSKIDTFLKAFSENCRNNYRIGSNICLGRKSVVHKHKKLLRSKKWIFKLLILADSMTGYVWNFNMLPGIADRSTKENAILQLVNNLDYNFHHLFLKNPFKNLELIFILNQMGFGVTSKLKEGMPGLEPNSNNLITTFFNNPEFLYCIYHYKEPIHFISNIKTAKTRQVNKKGAQESVSVPKMITGYLKSIQGTKYFDQLAHEYPVAKKDPKWWRCCFSYILQIALFNSYIIYKHFINDQLVEDLSFEEFCIKVALNIGDYKEETPGMMLDDCKPSKLKEGSSGSCLICMEHGKKRMTTHRCQGCKLAVHIKCMKGHFCKKKY